MRLDQALLRPVQAMNGGKGGGFSNRRALDQNVFVGMRWPGALAKTSSGLVSASSNPL